MKAHHIDYTFNVNPHANLDPLAIFVSSLEHLLTTMLPILFYGLINDRLNVVQECIAVFYVSVLIYIVTSIEFSTDRAARRHPLFALSRAAPHDMNQAGVTWRTLISIQSKPIFRKWIKVILVPLASLFDNTSNTSSRDKGACFLVVRSPSSPLTFSLFGWKV